MALKHFIVDDVDGVSRRQLLVTAATTSTAAGCTRLRSGEKSPTPLSQTAHHVAGKPGQYQLENGGTVVTVDTGSNPLAACDSIRTPDEQLSIRPIRIRPKTPTSSTTKAAPADARLVRHESTEASDISVGYRILRSFTLNDTPIRIEWSIRLARPHPLLVVSNTIENRGDSRLRIDQDRADTHNGLQLCSRFGLLGTNDNSRPDWRYCLPRIGERKFANQPRWKTHPNARWVSVTAAAGGAILTFLDGHTAPKMVVVNDDALDYMVNEFYLDPDERAKYHFAVSLVADSRPSPSGARSTAEHARQWYRNHLRSE